MTQPTAPFAQFAPRTRSPTRCARTLPPPIAAPSPSPGPLLAQARLPQELATASQQLALRIAKSLRRAQGQRWSAGLVQGCCGSFHCHPKKAWR